MLPAFRQQQIVARLEGAGFVTVASLADDLAVDDSTIRRDLVELERDGLVRRVRGGAMPPQPALGQPVPSGSVDPAGMPSAVGPAATPRRRRPAILASLTSADPGAVGQAAERLIEAGVDGLHLDIADGSFVPEITFGPRLVHAIRRRLPDGLLDVHLMVEDPERFIDELVVADRITFHVEATRYPWRVVTLVRRAGVRMVGVALNPATPIDALEGMPDGVSLVNILSTEPDVDGERFLAPTIPRVRAIRSRRGPATTVVVDGGVTETTIRSVVDAGASEIVVGRAIIGADDPAAALERLRRLCR